MTKTRICSSQESGSMGKERTPTQATLSTTRRCRRRPWRTSYDTGNTPAVSYEYHAPKKDADGKHGLWHAVTNNKVTFDAGDDSVIQTVLQIDGLGRAVRTAKTGFVNGVEAMC